MYKIHKNFKAQPCIGFIQGAIRAPGAITTIPRVFGKGALATPHKVFYRRSAPVEAASSAFGRRKPRTSSSSDSGTSAFLCTECGFTSPKWYGQCPSCKEWDSFKLHTIPKEKKNKGSSVRRPDQETAARLSGTGKSLVQENTGLQSIQSVSKRTRAQRRQLFAPEIDRVLGGGLMPGSVNLVAGAPGIGKSTLLMQLAVALSGGTTSTGPESLDDQDDIVAAAARNRPSDYETRPVVYISGEESVEQLKDRADRLNNVAPNLFVLNQTNVDDTLADITEMTGESGGLGALIVDSIQAMYMNDVPSAAGTVSQVRECALQFLHYSKSTGVPVFLVGHVTKSGDIAGPKILEHMVDTVLSLEGDSHYNHRILRSVKNRSVLLV
eukprot:gb/GECG01003839.1/.p1 GENE.gb/GECG01003839.1/~~gb/GECG01003839.1/.p1  ORF type:complete len:382 (+),score=47.00 gb/GECG01003839.1/:1-1146(+)